MREVGDHILAGSPEALCLRHVHQGDPKTVGRARDSGAEWPAAKPYDALQHFVLARLERLAHQLLKLKAAHVGHQGPLQWQGTKPLERRRVGAADPQLPVHGD